MRSDSAASDLEWRIEPGLTAYPEAVAFMEARAAAIADGDASELVWLVEHPPIYTPAGTSANDAKICSMRDSRCSRPAAAGNSPIMVRVSASAM